MRRYERERAGELIHVDIKKLAAIPDGGGWKTRGRGYEGEGAAARRVGYRYIHSALDDRSRTVYSEIHHDEKATSAAGFWRRAVAFYAELGLLPTCSRSPKPCCSDPSHSCRTPPRLH